MLRVVMLATGTILFAAPVFAQDIVAGERSFNKCRACHQVGVTAKNGVGPKLNGLLGRPAGSVDGFNYSAANKSSGIIWDEAVFVEYIKDPKVRMPGTRMNFPGIKNEQEVKDLVAFLTQFDKEGGKK